MATLERGSLFDAHLSKEIFSKVKGHSSLAKMSGQSPIPFNGTKEFTFDFDKEVNIVAEGGAKPAGGVSVAPVTIVPVKIEYGARVTDEFMYASDEEALLILDAWIDGYAKKAGRGLDIMAFLGVNPRTSLPATSISGKHFNAKIPAANKVGYTSGTDAADDKLDAAARKVTDTGYLVSGVAFAPTFAGDMSKIKANGIPLYPEFRFGQNPNSFAGMTSDVNNTVSFGNSGNFAIVGDFVNAFKWGIAKDLNLEVIEYGNPDNDAEAGDLKGHNQVYLRSETYIGWGILDGNAFAMVTAPPTIGTLTVTSVAGTETGDTKITVSPAKADANNVYKYKVGSAAETVTYDQNVQAWTLWDGSADITAETGKKITVVEATSEYKARKAGSATVIAKA